MSAIHQPQDAANGSAGPSLDVAALLEDVEFLASVGCGVEEVAHRLGFAKPRRLEWTLDRLGRRDLIRHMAHNTNPTSRPAACRLGHIRTATAVYS